MFKNTFEIESSLRPFANDASARLNYLFLGVQFIVQGNAIEMRSDHPLEGDELSQEISYALYRSKIRHEGMANRSALYSAVLSE